VSRKPAFIAFCGMRSGNSKYWSMHWISQPRQSSGILRVVFERLMKGNLFLISLHHLIKPLLNFLVLGQEKSRQRRRTNRYSIRGVNEIPSVSEASWDHISLKQLFKELLYNNITPYMKNYFWWKSVTFNRMVRHHVTTVKQEGF
jgi:hypothetical protein